MRKNTIVITGGAGFVGTNLINLLLKKTKYQIISIDNYSSGFFKNHTKDERIKYIKGDTMNISKILKNPKKINSIFHFGEQYLESKGIYKIQNNWFLSVFTPFILHGLLVFNLIFLNNLADVNLILEKFTINELSNNILNITLLIISFFYLISILYNSSVRIHFINEILFFGLFYIITKNSTLLFSFAFYFAFFHSILSMNDQIKFVYGKVSYSNIRKYILFASPYFILALIFLYILYNNFNVYSDQFLPLFFSFLAAITFPHVFVIEKMYNKMK